MAWLERELRCDAIDPDRVRIPVAQESIRAGWDMWLPLLGCAIVLSVLEGFATRHGPDGRMIDDYTDRRACLAVHRTRFPACRFAG